MVCIDSKAGELYISGRARAVIIAIMFNLSMTMIYNDQIKGCNVFKISHPFWLGADLLNTQQNNLYGMSSYYSQGI